VSIICGIVQPAFVRESMIRALAGETQAAPGSDCPSG
jgi:hypothetical protein